MEWFWKIIDHLQKSVASSALRSFSPFDWIILILIFWGLVQGSRKGFSDMLGKLLGIFLVSMLTLSFYGIGAENLAALLPIFSIKIAKPCAFFLLAILFWLSVSWCLKIFGKFLKVEALGILRTLGGVVFGGLRMVLLLSFLAQFLLFLPMEPVQQLFKPGHTYTGYTISQFVPDLHKLVMSPFRKPVSQKIAEAVKVGG